MEPFYFGKSDKLLFGIYHPPQKKIICNVGVVFCYPMGQEYILSYRALFQLATLLSSAGIPVLRFDYYGCGDSEGDCKQGKIHKWLSDISTAIEKLKGTYGVNRICLIGLRLGGSLAALSGVKCGNIEGMILWDPVVSGKLYVDELKILHQKWLNNSFAKSKHQNEGEKYCEILGFPITNSMMRDLEKINLLAIRQKPATKILIINNSANTNKVQLLKEYLEGTGSYVNYKYFPGHKIWIKQDDKIKKGLGSLQIFRYMKSWIYEKFL